jgi:hypothetical protein
MPRSLAVLHADAFDGAVRDCIVPGIMHVVAPLLVPQLSCISLGSSVGSGINAVQYTHGDGRAVGCCLFWHVLELVLPAFDSQALRAGGNPDYPAVGCHDGEVLQVWIGKTPASILVLGGGVIIVVSPSANRGWYGSRGRGWVQVVVDIPHKGDVLCCDVVVRKEQQQQQGSKLI